MITAAVALSILDSLLKVFVITLEKATPDQVQGIIDRHEARLAWVTKVIKSVLPDFGD